MRLLVTRPEPGAQRSAGRLESMGHDVFVDPLFRIEYLQPGLQDITSYQALLATSVNGVQGLVQLFDGALPGLPFFTVGDRTADAAETAGFNNVYSSDGSAAELESLITTRLRPDDGPLLYAAGRERTGNLDGRLRKAEFSVTALEVYQTIAASQFHMDTLVALSTGEIDAVLLYSTRAAEHFFALARKNALLGRLKTITFICLSSKIAETAAAFGPDRCLIATQPREDALFDLLAAI